MTKREDTMQEHELLGAIARGWTHPENEHKEIDVDLVFAIAKEIQKSLPARRPLPDFLVYEGHETPQYIQGWNECRELMKDMK